MLASNAVPAAVPFRPGLNDTLWPPVGDLARLAKYLRGYKLYKGEHKDLYEPTRDELKHGPYVVCNVARAVSRVISDRMALETPRATVGNDEEINDLLATILQASDWGRLVLRSLRGWSYRGDLVYKAFVRSKRARPEGLFRKIVNRLTGRTGEENEVLISEVRPDQFFPEWDPEDAGRMAAASICWQVVSRRDGSGKSIEWYQRVERHTPGLIENKLYVLRSDAGSLSQRFQRDEVALASTEQFANVKPQVETGIDEIPVVHIPNNEVGEEWPWGNSDFAGDIGFETNQRTLNERATDHRHMLRKWADPMIAVDPSYFETGADGRKQANVYEYKAIPIEPGEEPPKFVSVPLENYPHSDAEAERALRRMLWTVGVSPESLGISQGTYPESGRAIRLRQADTLGTVARKWVSYQPGLRRLLSIGLQLAKVHAGGPEAVPPEEIHIEHGDGLVQDERERLEELALKQQLGVSAEQITRELYPDWDDEAIEAELERQGSGGASFEYAAAPTAGAAPLSPVRAGTSNAPPEVVARTEELAEE